jgi:hypothetical protein
MKAYWGSEGLAPRILWSQHYMEVSRQFHAPAALLHPGKEPLVPIRLEAGWAPEQIRTIWWREKFLAPAGTRIPDRLARSSALYVWAIMTLVSTQAILKRLNNSHKQKIWFMEKKFCHVI